jgi:hypothetical protein
MRGEVLIAFTEVACVAEGGIVVVKERMGTTAAVERVVAEDGARSRPRPGAVLDGEEEEGVAWKAGSMSSKSSKSGEGAGCATRGGGGEGAASRCNCCCCCCCVVEAGAVAADSRRDAATDDADDEAAVDGGGGCKNDEVGAVVECLEDGGGDTGSHGRAGSMAGSSGRGLSRFRDDLGDGGPDSEEAEDDSRVENIDVTDDREGL